MATKTKEQKIVDAAKKVLTLAKEQGCLDDLCDEGKKAVNGLAKLVDADVLDQKRIYVTVHADVKTEYDDECFTESDYKVIVKSFKVKVTKETFNLVQDIALARGFSWINWHEKPKLIKYITGYDIISFNMKTKELCRSIVDYIEPRWNFEEIELENIIDRIDGKLPDIIINNNVVEFSEKEIKIGCTTVSKDTVKEIYDRLFKKEQA